MQKDQNGQGFYHRVERCRGGGSRGMTLVIADPTQMGNQEQVQWKEDAAVNYRPAILFLEVGVEMEPKN